MTDRFPSPSKATRQRVQDFNDQVDAGTLANDPRDGEGPLSDIVCGWCGKIHLPDEDKGTDE